MQYITTSLYTYERFGNFMEGYLLLAEGSQRASLEQKLSYANDYIRTIENSNEEPAVVLGITAKVHCEMSQWYLSSHNYVAAEEESQIAIDLALRSRYSEAIYSAYNWCGTLQFALGNLDRALLAHQKALPHAVDALPNRVASTLMSVAMIWEWDPNKLEVAEAMYEWAILVDPFTMAAMEMLHELKKRRLGAKALRLSLKEIPLESCDNIARHLAAYAALNDKRRACEAARLGLDKATEISDNKWQYHFKSYLDKYCS